jgi:hypothetical protein
VALVGCKSRQQPQQQFLNLAIIALCFACGSPVASLKRAALGLTILFRANQKFRATQELGVAQEFSASFIGVVQEFPPP